MVGTPLLSFTSGPDPFPSLRVHRVELVDALNEPFTLTVEITSTDPAVDPRAVVGREARLALEGEPFLPELRGLVKRCRQRTSVALPDGASLYDVSIVPPLWLLANAFGRRIHQGKTAVEIVTATLASHAAVASAQPQVKLTRAPRVHEYRAQYDETDLAFVRRVLADEHISAYFDPTNGGAWTLSDDLSSSAPVVPVPLVFRPPTDLLTTTPHVLHLVAEGELATRAVSLRDYD